MELPFYGVKDAVKRIKAQPTDQLPKRQKGSGLARKTELTPALEALGADLKENPDQSLNFLAQKYGLARRTAQRYVKNTLKLCPLKKIKASALTDAHMEKRKIAAATYLRLIAEGTLDVERIVRKDEKLFRINRNGSVSAKNTRVYIPESIDERDVPAALLTVRREKYKGASVMVAGGVCSRGVVPRHFASRGVKINAAEYQSLLSNRYGPEINALCPDGAFALMEDGSKRTPRSACTCYTPGRRNRLI